MTDATRYCYPKSKNASSNGTSGILQSQNARSNSPIVQLGTTSVVPNATTTAGIAPTATAGTSANSTFIIEERLQEVLRIEVEKARKMVSTVKFQSPYSHQVIAKPYPKDYVKLKLKNFDGRKENLKEHIVSYIDDLGKYADDENLRLREFSKSLTDKAYSSFVNLLVNSI